MEVIVSARHFNLGEALKQAATQGVESALADMSVKISSVRVTLDYQKSTFCCDIVAMGKGIDFSASAEAVNDMGKAIGDATEKLRVQARRYLEKKQDHRDRDTLNDVPTKSADND